MPTRNLAGKWLPRTREQVFWKGGQGDAVLRGLKRGGYEKGFYPVSGGQDFSLLLEEFEPTGGLFLFKGSRGNNLNALWIFSAKGWPQREKPMLYNLLYPLSAEFSVLNVFRYITFRWSGLFSPR